MLLLSAKKLAVRLPSLPSDDFRDLLASVLRRIVIRENNVEVMISKTDLRQLLENGGKVPATNLLGRLKPVIDVHDLINLTIETKRKRCGGEVLLVVPPNSSLAVGRPKCDL